MAILSRFLARVLRPEARDGYCRLREQLPPGVLYALLEAGAAVYQIMDHDESVERGDRGKWFVSTSSHFCDVDGDFTYTDTELEAWQQAAEIFGPHLQHTAWSL